MRNGSLPMQRCKLVENTERIQRLSTSHACNRTIATNWALLVRSFVTFCRIERKSRLLRIGRWFEIASSSSNGPEIWQYTSEAGPSRKTLIFFDIIVDLCILLFISHQTLDRLINKLLEWEVNSEWTENHSDVVRYHFS